MSKVNLLNWRRKKLIQRTRRVIVAGILLIGLLGISTYITFLYHQTQIGDLRMTNALSQELAKTLVQRIHQQQSLLEQIDFQNVERKRIEQVQHELATYSFFFNG
ncbi:hypothetical protein HGT73_07985 [Rosenbergiella australiborealis]|uniref:Uncharacterized protein n=1 Tax=Rosenbergiella australiborealis TaxID=1544696 RepID=A0ABS5T4P8_9GAMM|nr:hypothetical protein [Rosenbergiella australiborealis]MBT0727324.1 hypothetical protein [Rosenbergiella australiborealis]